MTFISIFFYMNRFQIKSENIREDIYLIKIMYQYEYKLEFHFDKFDQIWFLFYIEY